MIFEKLNFFDNSKLFQVRAKTPSLCRSFCLRRQIRKKSVGQQVGRMSEGKRTSKENTRNLEKISKKIDGLSRLPDVLKEKNHVFERTEVKTRYVRAYTPNELILNSINYCNDVRSSAKITPRKVYKRLLEKTSKEIRFEGLNGWMVL